MCYYPTSLLRSFLGMSFLEPGLLDATLDGYYGSNLALYSSTPSSTQTISVLNITNIPQNTSRAMIGYFKPLTSGTLNFSFSFKGSQGYVWIGDSANAPLVSNTTLKCIDTYNLGLTVVQTTSITVDSNTYYPFRLYCGSNTGLFNMSLSMSGTGMDSTSDFTGTLFHDTRITNII